MASYGLILTPDRKAPQEILLHQQGGGHSILDYLKDYDSRVYSDLTYDALIVIEPKAEIRIRGFYVNGNAIDIDCTVDGKISFQDISYGARIFSDCYGFVQISIAVQTSSEELLLESDYISVMVRKGRQNDSVRRMANYVYEHNEPLLYSNDVRPKDLSGLKESDYKSLESRIILLDRIALQYEKNYRYFKTNSRFRTVACESVDNFEKLQYVSSGTVRYIVQHPEELERVNCGTGIRVNQDYYQPRKTLITKNIYSFDIYENRVIVGFLRSTVLEIEQIISTVQNTIKSIPSEKEEMDGYVSSSFFIYTSTRSVLNTFLSNLHRLSDRYIVLFGSYQHALNVTLVAVKTPPQPTAILLSVPQYRQLYDCIVAWFDLGIFNLKQEEFILSFLKISTLYECYVLSKMIQFLQNRGFMLSESQKCTYTFWGRTLYKNTSCNNTFVFHSDDMAVTLYYQPVIYFDDRRDLNGIGLYRNTTISFPKNLDTDSHGTYYTPDFIIKIQSPENGATKYLIMDAKFSTLDVVKRCQVAALSYKYLFSISPLDTKDSVIGLCIFNGQSDSDTDMLTDIYDKSRSPGAIYPQANILTLTENSEDNTLLHVNLFKGIFDKYLFG